MFYTLSLGWPYPKMQGACLKISSYTYVHRHDMTDIFGHELPLASLIPEISCVEAQAYVTIKLDFLQRMLVAMVLYDR